jgi:hypothetical protein
MERYGLPALAASYVNFPHVVKIAFLHKGISQSGEQSGTVGSRSACDHVASR